MQTILARLRAWLQARLIPDWRTAYTKLSVIFSLAGTTASGAWLFLSDDQKADLLRLIGVRPGVLTLITFIAVVVGRLLRQKGDDEH